MDLHELASESVQTGNSQRVIESSADREKALLPVAPVLADDIFYVVFIDEEVPVKDRIRRRAVLRAFKDFLLVFERDLGIRDYQGQQECVGFMTFGAENPLDREQDRFRHELQAALIMAIKNQASLFAAGAFKPVELEGSDCPVINIL